jgi:hypothetical protein
MGSGRSRTGGPRRFSGQQHLQQVTASAGSINASEEFGLATMKEENSEDFRVEASSEFN